MTIDGYNDGPDDGTPNEPAVTVAIGAVGVWTTIAYGVSAQLQADGSVIFTGVQEGDQYGITTGSNFNAVAVTSVAAGTGPVGNLSSTDSFDLGVFSIGQFETGDPIDLSFGVTATDADGDTSTGTIDVTLVPAPVSPVVLDMDGDGVEFLAASAGVTYDYGNGLVATAWAGADDAILVRDANGNGIVDGVSEFVFGGNGLTDLQALALQYGSTLDASDADFGSFAVWRDANSNGRSDPGELISLTAAGITSISLVSDGIAYIAAGGDVQVAGTATYTRADGSTGTLADAAFVTAARVEQEQRTMSAANNNSVLLGAIAAAGLGISMSAAAHDFDPGLQQFGLETGRAVAESTSTSRSADAADTVRNALGNETREAVEDQSSSASSTGRSADSGQHSLTAGGDQGQAPSALPAGTEAQQSAPAQSTLTSAAVGMPSAEMLLANANEHALDGQAQGKAEVGRVLADALAGGNGPNIDAVLDAVTNGGQGGGAAALEALATHGAGGVSAWHTAGFGGFTGSPASIIPDPMLHQDAVVTAA